MLVRYHAKLQVFTCAGSFTQSLSTYVPPLLFVALVQHVYHFRPAHGHAAYICTSHCLKLDAKQIKCILTNMELLCSQCIPCSTIFHLQNDIVWLVSNVLRCSIKLQYQECCTHRLSNSEDDKIITDQQTYRSISRRKCLLQYGIRKANTIVHDI